MTGGIAVALLPSTIRFSPEREEFSGRLQALIVAETGDARGIEDASDALADFLEDQGYNTDQDWIGDDKLTTMDLEQFDESLSQHEANALFTEGWIALGTTRKSVMEIHDTLNGETPPLASYERFSQLAEL